MGSEMCIRDRSWVVNNIDTDASAIFRGLYDDAYDCMVDGYNKASDKTIEMGRETVNEYNVFIKFGCTPRPVKPSSAV